MYNHFFGFKEKPFRLIPNPDYLYLSRSHEEALAHLKYAAIEGEGFVEIIGEVGTGKTMLCRAFLENIGADTESAYIFNPKMSATELLKSINDEFGIPSDPTGTGGTKSLIDALNAYLMEKRAEGKKVILLIDEAQNLSPEVLEQIRLLSNLETTKEKLLQIILVGQPELGLLLYSHALRQIGQRISLRCRLKPLSFADTRAYIRHRIHVASRKPAVIFSRSAIRKIHRYAHGIPRLINIACDRALLAAYGANRRRVTGGIARATIGELSSSREIKRDHLAAGQKRLAVLFLLCAGLFGVLIYQPQIKRLISDKPLLRKPHVPLVARKSVPVAAQPVNSPTPDAAASPARVVAAPKRASHPDSVRATAASPPAASSPSPHLPELQHVAVTVNLKSVLKTLPAQTTRAAALKIILSRWGTTAAISTGLKDIKDDDMFFTLSARQNGMRVERLEKSGLPMIRNLNLCAILEFMHPQKHYPVYLPLIRADQKTLTFIDCNTGNPVDVPSDEIKPLWKGTAYIFWKNFYNYQGIIPRNSPKSSILALKMQLQQMGFEGIDLNTDYDQYTQLAVKAIQARYGIPVDGSVGPLTKIVLYNATPSLAIPHLQGENNHTQSRPAPTEAKPLPRRAASNDSAVKGGIVEQNR